MGRYVLGLEEIDGSQVVLVGGKGANLGELSRIHGIRVPAGYCVTTDALRRVMAEAPSIDGRLDRLSRLRQDDRDAIRARSAAIRRAIGGTDIPDDLAAAITRPLARLYALTPNPIDARSDVVGEAGLEPAISCSQSTCVTRLRYSPPPHAQEPTRAPVAPRATVAYSARRLSPPDEHRWFGHRHAAAPVCPEPP